MIHNLSLSEDQLIHLSLMAQHSKGTIMLEDIPYIVTALPYEPEGCLTCALRDIKCSIYAEDIYNIPGNILCACNTNGSVANRTQFRITKSYS